MKAFAKTLLASTLLSVPLMPSASFAADAVPTVPDGISGVVTSSSGPEAGVWVIAETLDLPTRFIKIVVTDDQGRYVAPELPKGKYKVWVRGYGLVDSPPLEAAPGSKLNLKAVVAPDRKAAAEYYPPNYWLSLLKMPTKDEFPGTGPKGNGISPRIKTQQQYITEFRICLTCHSLGSKYTRETPLPTVEGWLERIQKTRPENDPVTENFHDYGRRRMLAQVTQMGISRALSMMADWTTRIAAGEIPKETPPRPVGVERNIVLTGWDWGGLQNQLGRFIHDVTLTDRRNPALLADTKVYGSGYFTGTIPWLDPVSHTQDEIHIPSHQMAHNVDTTPHTPMMDQKGRVWMAGTKLATADKTVDGTSAALPAFCTSESNKYAKLFPLPLVVPTLAGAEQKTNTVTMYDPSQKRVFQDLICFGTHHLNFQRDTNDTLFFSGDTRVVSWLDTKIYDETKRSIDKATGWCPMVLDTNGDGKVTQDRTAWIDENGRAGAGEEAGTDNANANAARKVDQSKDTRIQGFLYGIETDPNSSAVWLAKYTPAYPSGIVRFERGANAPVTCMTEYYEPPQLPNGEYPALGARGVTVDSKGIVWASFSTGQMGLFDRSKCTVTKGPTATGQHCPAGWKFYDSPGPKLADGTIGTADLHYVIWADLYNTSGLGADTIMLLGSNSDSLLAFNQAKEKFDVMRVPYPLAFYTRNVEGRIDNPNIGWKGRGLWATYSHEPVWHQEGGDQGLGPTMVKFQVRPDPLAF
ncbi:MAG: carboxypeptidase regulatory-like domain-containing protein [Rhodospirillaceae bacterium]|nr:carboxypeptidase regulatory-like domain-containing protein [Rhodospirillaceae bacterium]